MARYEETARRALSNYHSTHTLRFVMPREELRGALNLPQREFAAVIGAMAPGLEVRSDGIVEADWEPQPSSQQRAIIEAARHALELGGLQPERVPIDPAIATYLVEAGVAVDCGEGVLLHTPVFEGARARIIEAMTGRSTPMTLAETRDLLGVSRRNAQAILEALDRMGVTMRAGDGRSLRAAR